MQTVMNYLPSVFVLYTVAAYQLSPCTRTGELGNDLKSALESVISSPEASFSLYEDCFQGKAFTCRPLSLSQTTDFYAGFPPFDGRFIVWTEGEVSLCGVLRGRVLSANSADDAVPAWGVVIIAVLAVLVCLS